MEIYYIDIEEFLVKYPQFTEFSNKELQHIVGRKIVFSVVEENYGIENPQIIVKNEKPYIKNNPVFFSISHSKNYVVVCFDAFECGIDIEKIRNVDLSLFSRRYKKNFKTPREFFEFWTNYEAEIKLQKTPQGKYFKILDNEYALTVLSEKNIDNDLKIINFISKK